MTDFYPVLARAASRLAVDVPQERQDLYNHARTILIAQLRKRDPQVSAQEIMRERAALESAIRQLEAETLPAQRGSSTGPNSHRFAANPGLAGGRLQARIDHRDLDAVFQEPQSSSAEANSVSFIGPPELRSAATSPINTESLPNLNEPDDPASDEKIFGWEFARRDMLSALATDGPLTGTSNRRFDELILGSQQNAVRETSFDQFADRMGRPQTPIRVIDDADALRGLDGVNQLASDENIHNRNRGRQDLISPLAAEPSPTEINIRGADGIVHGSESNTARGTRFDQFLDRKYPRPAIEISKHAEALQRLSEASHPKRDKNVREWELNRIATLSTLVTDHQPVRIDNRALETFQNPLLSMAQGTLPDPVADRLRSRPAKKNFISDIGAPYKPSEASQAAAQNTRTRESDRTRHDSRISSQGSIRSMEMGPILDVDAGEEPAFFGLALVGLTLIAAVLVLVAIICVPLVIIHVPRLLWRVQHLFDDPTALAATTVTLSLLLLLFVPIFRKRRRKSAMSLLWRSMRLTARNA